VRAYGRQLGQSSATTAPLASRATRWNGVRAVGSGSLTASGHRSSLVRRTRRMLCAVKGNAQQVDFTQQRATGDACRLGQVLRFGPLLRIEAERDAHELAVAA